MVCSVISWEQHLRAFVAVPSPGWRCIPHSDEELAGLDDLSDAISDDRAPELEGGRMREDLAKVESSGDGRE